MRHRMWMGTRGYEMWVPTPKISPSYSRSSFSSSTPLVDGGVSIQQSKGAHEEYVFEWNIGSWDDIMPIRDIANGIYDSHDGINLVYFNDPTAMARNLLPAHWAAPSLGGEDAPSLIVGKRPQTLVQPISEFGLPARSASWGAGGSPRTLYVPIPPGHTAHFGWVGQGNGQVIFREATATGPGNAQAPNGLGGADGVQTNAQISRYGTVIGVEIVLAGSGPVGIRAMTLRMLPTGQVPAQGRWRAGQGHSGVQFAEKAGLTPLSVPLDKIGATATLIETGDWL
jgi:hypothetical protein